MTNNPGTYATIDCDVIHITEKAICIDPMGNEDPEEYAWVPKSLLDPEEDVPEKGNGQEIFVARWFVEKEGLV